MVDLQPCNKSLFSSHKRLSWESDACGHELLGLGLVLLVEETGVPRENHQPGACH
jgi:hypothetical protein